MRPLLLVYPSFHRLQNTYSVLIQAQHGANKSPVSLIVSLSCLCLYPSISQIYRGQVREKTRVARRIAGADSDR